ncbi:DUF2177 family protein [Caulobacter endophyticus]|uniref:DUF2177 family protein n=1 Tax=Caulobacter endophyticus TaxID=2172652 RepID=UPI00240F6B96|nr:DUF2177 family protein [Caulobacter endophyticus]MDG2529411.1 DUF2177 family protein [Caulobacter endophyticus]
MLRYALGYLSTAVVFLALDAVWLTQMADRLYRPRIGTLMADTPSLPPAVAFYLIYIGAVTWFALVPALRPDGGWPRLLTNAALFGLAAYATYDLTNQATLKTWSTAVTLADMAWGAFVTTAAASAGYFVASRFAGR